MAWRKTWQAIEPAALVAVIWNPAPAASVRFALSSDPAWVTALLTAAAIASEIGAPVASLSWIVLPAPSPSLMTLTSRTSSLSALTNGYVVVGASGSSIGMTTSSPDALSAGAAGALTTPRLTDGPREYGGLTPTSWPAAVAASVAIALMWSPAPAITARPTPSVVS